MTRFMRLQNRYTFLRGFSDPKQGGSTPSDPGPVAERRAPGAPEALLRKEHSGDYVTDEQRRRRPKATDEMYR
jgi:hypothetical protein